MSEQYDFDIMADRSIDHARKWDPELIAKKYPGVRKDFIPMWIADMDFPTSPAIRKALVQLSDNGAYGYTYVDSTRQLSTGRNVATAMRCAASGS